MSVNVCVYVCVCMYLCMCTYILYIDTYTPYNPRLKGPHHPRDLGGAAAGARARDVEGV